MFFFNKYNNRKKLLTYIQIKLLAALMELTINCFYLTWILTKYRMTNNELNYILIVIIEEAYIAEVISKSIEKDYSRKQF